jgi:hypothetical protein
MIELIRTGWIEFGQSVCDGGEESEIAAEGSR